MTKALWGKYDATIREWLEKCAKQSVVSRLWQKDASLWTKDSAVQKEIRSRLGWLDVVDTMPSCLEDLEAFAEEIKAAGFTCVVLLGMGGSSLAADVLQSALGGKAGYPKLLLLDSTDPGKILDVESCLEIPKTLFIVSSKSGGTIELVSLFKYFFEKTKQTQAETAGEQFIAITDAGTPLEALAKSHSFRRVFLAPADVGGRFSALTYFGLVPACLAGVEIRKILESAREMKKSCAPDKANSENMALTLGVAMAVLAEEGRDKLTILTSEGLEAFGDWAEQLVAESSGKEELGIVPVVREAMEGIKVYGEDRFFVALLSDSEDNQKLKAHLAELEAAGHPVLILNVKDRWDVGGEFFRWEVAVAMACALLKVNAFDQPDVQAAKDKTKALLKSVESGSALAIKETTADFKSFFSAVAPADYVGLLAFLPDNPAIKKTFMDLQQNIRRRTKNATTLGFGPRYLHSTGQLHKGGPNTGDFLLITAAPERDLEVPGEKFSFGQLELAQAIGDLEALEAKGRRVLHVRLEDLSQKSLDDLTANIKDW